MATVTMAAEMTVPAPSVSTIRDYFTLLKPGVMTLVVFTGAIGLWAAPVAIHPFLQLIAIACIALASGAGGMINMWYDRDIDAVMARTAKRPIPAGRIPAEDALAGGIMLSVLSVGLMGLALNWQAAALLAFAIFFYAVVYTMGLKRRTEQNIVIGGLAGAFPPAIGWIAADPSFALTPWLMVLIIFLWTPPHFWALALYRHGDYAKARVPMLPVTAGIATTKKHILTYSIALVASSFAPLLVGYGIAYGAAALVLGAVFLWHAHRVYRSNEGRIAMAMFGYSILYLFLLFSALGIDRIL